VKLGTLDSTMVLMLSLALSTWLEQLPPALVINSHAKNALPHILMMHMSWAWLVILLHRPFYRPRAGMPGNSTKGQDTASYNAALAVKVRSSADVAKMTALRPCCCSDHYAPANLAASSRPTLHATNGNAMLLCCRYDTSSVIRVFAYG
jgi:hypothetical protein